MPYYGASSAGGTFLACYTDEAQDGQAVVNSAAAGYYDGKASSSDNIINNSLYDQLCQGIYICNVFLANNDLRFQNSRSNPLNHFPLVHF